MKRLHPLQNKASPVQPSGNLSVAEAASTRVPWIVVLMLALAFVSFNPFATDQQMYGAARSEGAPRIVWITVLGYVRYLGLAIAFFGVARYLLAQGTSKARTLGKVLLGAPWIVAWVVLLIPSFLLDGANIEPINLVVTILTLSAAIFLIVYLGTPQLILNSVYFALFGCLVASYVGVLLIPERAIHTSGADVLLNENLRGLWRGAFGHKNVAGGFFMELLLISGVMIARSKFSILAWASFVGSVVFLYFSGSNSSLVAPVVALTIFVVVRISRILGNLVPVVFASLYLCFPFLVVYWLYQYGVNLDSRYLIWRAGMQYASGHEFFGLGYLNGYGNSALASVVTERWMLGIGHAHSGVVDTYMYLGIAGLACLWWMVFSCVRSYVKILNDPRYTSERYYLIAGFLVYVAAVVRSAVEPDILTSRGGWLIMLLTGLLPLAVGASARRAGAKN